MSFPAYRQTPKNEPFKPGDNVQFLVNALSGRGWFLGQIWSKGPDYGSTGLKTYWVADGQAYHEVHINDLRMVQTRNHLNEDTETRAA